MLNVSVLFLQKHVKQIIKVESLQQIYLKARETSQILVANVIL